MALPDYEDYDELDDYDELPPLLEHEAWDEKRCDECGCKMKHCYCWDDDFYDPWKDEREDENE